MERSHGSLKRARSMSKLASHIVQSNNFTLHLYKILYTATYAKDPKTNLLGGLQ